MSLRQSFEKLFPVPEGVVFIDGNYSPKTTDWMEGRVAGSYNGYWQGFQAGHAAGLEDACTVMRANLSRDMADEMQSAIRAMKS